LGAVLGLVHDQLGEMGEESQGRIGIGSTVSISRSHAAKTPRMFFSASTPPVASARLFIYHGSVKGCSREAKGEYWFCLPSY
ncbi:hypothetical protein HQ520_04290, partial [bacterium]|nr:hypothetical protein [bacterium]